MTKSRKRDSEKASALESVAWAHDWMSPVDAASPCGPDLEYDPEFVVLTAQLVAKMDAQYGSFVGTPEPVNWSEVERECRRLMLRSKDIRLAVLFTRCRVRLSASVGLAEGLRLLAGWLYAFADTVHPQRGVDIDEDAALEIRMNALQALTDTDGLMADVREIALTRSTVARLQVRDVARAFAHPRPGDALAPESVMRQLDDLRVQQPEALAAFDDAVASLASIDEWCQQHLGSYQPDLSALSRLLRCVTGTDARKADTAPDTALGTTLGTEQRVGLSGIAETPVEHVPSADLEDKSAPSSANLSTYHSTHHAPRHEQPETRDDALKRIREARHWFERHEPSSPIPVLLRRAEQFVGKRYSQIVTAIPADLLAQWDVEA